jgi:hypothetical protein
MFDDNKNKTIEILESLANGINPTTGEIFPNDSPYQEKEIVNALFDAVSELKKSIIKGNQGSKWTDDEDVKLEINFEKGLKTTEIAKIHGRTAGAIRSRLIKLGLIEVEN